MLARLFFVFTIGALSVVSAQKKPITHDDYDLWKRVADTKISDEGKLVVSTIELLTGRGDGHVQIYNTETGNTAIFDRGYETAISADENYVVFKRKPAYETIRKEKKDDVKKDKQSKDALFIYDVKNNRLHDSIPRVKAYQLPEKYEGWLVMEKHKELKEEKGKKDSTETKTDSISTQKKDTTKQKVNPAFKQDYALVYRFETKSKDTIHQIKEFTVPKNGNSFIYALKQEKEKEWDLGVYTYDVANGLRTPIDTTKYSYSNLAVDEKGNQFAYMSSADSTAVDSLKFELNYLNENKLTVLVDSAASRIQKGWVLGKDKAPFFSESGKRLYFGVKPEVSYDRDTTMLDDEIPQVDVWNWQDKLLQPEQKVREKELKEKAFLMYYDTSNESYVTIQGELLKEVAVDARKEEKFILGNTNDAYALERSWAFPWKWDIYVIDSYTGDQKLLLEGVTYNPEVLPNNAFAIYFDMDAQDWFSIDLSTTEKRNLTAGLAVAFHDEDDDHPSLPYPYGFGGFDEDGNPLVYDKFDIWKLTADNSKAPINITKNGRLENIEYRLLNLDPEEENLASYLDGRLLITSFDKTTKESGLYTLRKGKLIEKLRPSGYLISNYNKAKEADVFTFTRQNFQVFPDILVTTDGFESNKKITDLNPHEKDFKWGTVEQFQWTAYDGTPLDGLLYKPEDFDPSKKYPMITYFYEKRSDTYNRHVSPSPSRSTVNAAYLVSNDYIMFVPDIVYKDGQPGESAFNCIVSGVEAVEKLGYIDSANMAIQGQSWGGYQVAYLVTKTNKFKAAMAGAPVSNMTSAYGGIRWGSGRSRAVQYERTQTRIGKDLWEGLDLYLENSPLFGIPNIETPLLMMHNDEDGAVPYYQGIEMFMGMRRLQKPAWLLVYNKEAHNLTQIKNRQDLSIRMMQFFDHFLKGAPAPKWMNQGLPRIAKEKDLGYDLGED
ncbi:S9 family peptidase [Aggregatimonas sangjinii]|uniref:S9 family peptidase n=1 Tax=Aggregatimonas sangjinii TaxID=2583587 RepID=A0A5B7SYZ4_9FLAO|nr:prolyl oligopeptidase family serine peptidase [Aggregatimonas sangjinii]QCX02161.1 S9 family peptidase [Aggregatimonas sangjinii]